MDFTKPLLEIQFFSGDALPLDKNAVWLNAFGDGVLALSYFVIPFGLYYFVKKKKTLRFSGVILLFACFIFMCGVGRLLGMLSIWYPVYRLLGITKFVTAIFSVATAIELIRKIPVALKIPSPADLTKANEELEHKTKELKEQNQFLRNLAYATYHDLREPIRGMTINSQVLMLRHDDKLNDEMREIVKHIAGESKRMYHSVDSIINFTFLESEKYRFEKVDLGNVLQLGIKRLNGLVDNNHTEIKYDKLPVVIGNEALLVMLFENVIGNSIRFRSEKNPVIVVEAMEEPECHRIEFTDNGVGFSNEYKEQVFEMFKRLGNSINYRGAGLGLAIARRIVQMHNGSIEADSKEGEGTTIIVRLPKIM